MYEFGGRSLFSLKEQALDEGMWPEDGITCRYFTASQWITIMNDLLHALAYLESQGIVHSDIKPTNIVYDGKHAKIIDLESAFRIPNWMDPLQAYAFGPDHPILIRMVTAKYLPPELYHEIEKCVYASIDIYCFGLSLYMLMLTKQIKDFDEEYKQRYQNTSGNEYPAFLNEVRKLRLLNDPDNWLSSHIIEFLLSCLDYEPRKRPSFRQAYTLFDAFRGETGTFDQNQKALLKQKAKVFSTKELIFTSTHIRTYETFLLARKIESMPKLRELFLSGQISDYELILKAVLGNKSLRTLNMRVGINSQIRNAWLIRNVLICCESLKSLCLSGIALCGEDFATVFDGAVGESEIEDLRLIDCKIPDEGIIMALSQYKDVHGTYKQKMYPKSTLRYLNLSENKITYKGVEEIARFVEGGYGIKYIGLRGNRLWYKGIKRMMEMAAKVPNIVLSLEDNDRTLDQCEEIKENCSRVQI